MARPPSSNKAVKFAVSMPQNLYLKLVEVLRTPFSTAPEGKLETGVMSNWVQEVASSTIANAGRYELLEKFLSEKGLGIEFEQFYRSNCLSTQQFEELL